MLAADGISSTNSIPYIALNLFLLKLLSFWDGLRYKTL